MTVLLTTVESSLSAPTTLLLLQPGFVVFVIQPNISDATRTSTGPKEPTPRAATRAPSPSPALVEGWEATA